MSGFKAHFEVSGGIDTENTESNLTEAHREEIRQIAARYPQKRSALIPALHLVQSVDGRVSPKGLEMCAEELGISESDVNGVATFYTMYKRKPTGKHLVGVCTTALCAIMGGDHIFEALSDHLGIGNDETSADGAVTLERVECNAACDYAPVVMVNWEFFDNMTPDAAIQLVDDLAAGTLVTATRGAEITSWREAERVLAGFDDGRTDQGPPAGPASLLGLTIARDNDWHAPDPANLPAPDTSEGESK